VRRQWRRHPGHRTGVRLPRAPVVMACRVAGVTPPLDGPFLGIGDPEAFLANAVSPAPWATAAKCSSIPDDFAPGVRTIAVEVLLLEILVELVEPKPRVHAGGSGQDEPGLPPRRSASLPTPCVMTRAAAKGASTVVAWPSGGFRPALELTVRELDKNGRDQA
jgi:hypothetical protein